MWIRTDIPKQDIIIMVVLYVAANVASSVASALLLRWIFM